MSLSSCIASEPVVLALQLIVIGSVCGHVGIDGDKLYSGVRKLIAEHLDDLAAKDIVPTFPRSGVMNSNTTLSNSFKHLGLGSGSGAVEEAGPSTASAKSGSGGPNVQSIESALEGERFLKALKAVWDDHISSMDKLSKILKYMVSCASGSVAAAHCIY